MVCSSSAAGADRGGAPGMRDEGLARAALLPLVRAGGEAEGARDELDVDVRVVGGELGEQPFEELLVPLPAAAMRHRLSVLRGFCRSPV